MQDFISKAVKTESNQFHPINERILHSIIGLTTESGELMDAVKKCIFYGKELDLVNIKEEAGDIMWYLAILFDELGTNFETEANRVITKLETRFPERFTSEKALNRDLDSERNILESI